MHDKYKVSHHFLKDVIWDVSLVLTDAVSRRVAEDDGGFADLQHLVHHLFWHVSQVHQHAHAVHFTNQSL